jgi:phage terminase small subunit
MGEAAEDSEQALRSYAAAVDVAAAAQAAWKAAGSPLPRQGNDRNPEVAHPLFTAILDAQAHESRLSDKLGLTPGARHAMSRRAGRPKSSDRETPMIPASRRDPKTGRLKLLLADELEDAM